MPTLPYYFVDFLQEIRPGSDVLADYKAGHRELRERLDADEKLAPILVSTFLQGSYRRATALRPEGDKRADVDVVVVTRLDEDEYTPQQALDTFVPFLDKHYKGKYEPQGRSFGIRLGKCDLDLVVTSAPSEAEAGLLKAASVTASESPEEADDWRLVKSWIPLGERDAPTARGLMEASRKEPEWQLSPLHIPDRDANCWEPTHPLEQIKWTWAKNRRCNGHYVNVVKAIKWWRRINHPTPKYPKGYPVEHLVGICCPDAIDSVAEGVTLTLETIAREYKGYAGRQQTPFVPDHGVPDHNVFGRVAGKDFATFHAQVCRAAQIARRALDAGEDEIRESVAEWQKLFGTAFPDPPNEGESDGPKTGGYSPRTGRSVIREGRFAEWKR